MNIKEDQIQEDIKQFEVLRSRRKPLEADWNDIIAYVLPSKTFFGVEDPDNVPETDPEKYDSTAVIACSNLVSTYMQGLINQGTEWFEIAEPAIQDQEAFEEEFGDLDLYYRILEEQKKEMYKVLNDPKVGFYRSVQEMLKEDVALGTGPVHLSYVFGKGIRFKSVGLSGIFIASDKDGNIDTVYHRFHFTARQAAQKWGYKAISESMKEALKEKPHQKFEIIRVVKPEESYLKKMKTNSSYTSKYIAKSESHLLSEGILKDNPFFISRWDTFINQDYGVGQAWYALPDILLLQDLVSLSYQVFQQEANKNLLVAHDSVMMPSNSEYGGPIYGGLDNQGRQLVRPLDRGGRPDLFEARIKALSDSIKSIFLDNSLNNQDLQRMTELEVSIRAEEKNNIISPNSRRIEAEFLMPALQRVYKMMIEHDMFPTIPKEFKKFFAGRKLNIKFTGPLARTADIQETNIARNWLINSLLPLAQMNPSIMDNIDANEYARLTAKGQGVPLSIITPKALVLEKENQRRENEEAQIQANLQQNASKEQVNGE